MSQEMIAKRQQQVLHDKKWIKFLRRTWLFRYIPFVEFALTAGSLATGSVKSDSDFDVIVGARSGRIFTARFFSVIGFGFFGWRRRKMRVSNPKNPNSIRMPRKLNSENSDAFVVSERLRSSVSENSDKVCLNHFITEASYRLSPPHNAYWKNLYQNLVPIYGEPGKINKFFAANADWCAEKLYLDDLRHGYRHQSWFQRIAEKLLGNSLGDWLERKLKALQVARIEKSIPKEAGYKPRIIYSDSELEFHPDTRRTE